MKLSELYLMARDISDFVDFKNVVTSKLSSVPITAEQQGDIVIGYKLGDNIEFKIMDDES